MVEESVFFQIESCLHTFGMYLEKGLLCPDEGLGCVGSHCQMLLRDWGRKQLSCHQKCLLLPVYHVAGDLLIAASSYCVAYLILICILQMLYMGIACSSLC